MYNIINYYTQPYCLYRPEYHRDLEVGSSSLDS